MSDTCIVCDDLLGDEPWEQVRFLDVDPKADPPKIGGMEDIADNPDVSLLTRGIHERCQEDVIPAVPKSDYE